MKTCAHKGGSKTKHTLGTNLSCLDSVFHILPVDFIVFLISEVQQPFCKVFFSHEAQTLWKLYEFHFLDFRLQIFHESKYKQTLSTTWNFHPSITTSTLAYKAQQAPALSRRHFWHCCLKYPRSVFPGPADVPKAAFPQGHQQGALSACAAAGHLGFTRV